MPNLLSNSFFQLLFDMNPNGMILINSNGLAIAANPEAYNLFCVQSNTNFPCTKGELFQCINAIDGCGKSSSCTECILRRCFNLCMTDQAIHRLKSKFVVHRNNELKEFTFLVTSKSISFQEETFVLLIIEDVSLITELSGLLPICSSCHNIRDEEGNWIGMAKYLRNHSEAEFTHDYCPDCAEELKSMRRIALSG